MAISIPIISEFDGKGIEKARKEFSQLEGVGAKSQYAIKKAAIPAAAALAGVGAALFDATQGAIEDAAAQDKLASSLKRTTDATDAQIDGVEDWITKQGQLLGISDDKLRPAFDRLARATGNIAEAQKLATQAMDISAATGKPLETVIGALEKAYGGNLTALQKLAPEYRDLIKSGASFDEVMAQLSLTTSGAATDAANTAAGQFQRLKLSLDETKESIGAALLPIVQAVLPYLQKFATWAQENPGVFLAIAGAITAISVAIMAVNAAMALNPFSAIAAGIAVLVVGVITAYKKFEWFRTGVQAVINGIATYFEFITNAWIKVINTIIRGINLVKPGKDIPTIGAVSIGRLGGESAANGLSGADISRFEGMGSVRGQSIENNTVINVNGGDPNAVVDALRRYQQLNGSIPIRVGA